VIDTASNDAIATIHLDIEPRALALSTDGRSLYVASPSAGASSQARSD
jgi:DNA-binding beta-propeller fold protein YncE